MSLFLCLTDLVNTTLSRMSTFTFALELPDEAATAGLADAAAAAAADAAAGSFFTDVITTGRERTGRMGGRTECEMKRTEG
jgi:hypothetical protein